MAGRKESYLQMLFLNIGVSKDGVDVLLYMMNPSPAGRITATELLSHLLINLQRIKEAVSVCIDSEKGSLKQ